MRIREARASEKCRQQILILDSGCKESEGKSLFGAGFTEQRLLASERLGFVYATAPGKRSFEPIAGEKEDIGHPIEKGLLTHFLSRVLRGEAQLGADEFVTFYKDKSHKTAYSTANGTVSSHELAGEWIAVAQNHGGTFSLDPQSWSG